jgi:alpha-tubulin suppressor-like RCC1 family protein
LGDGSTTSRGTPTKVKVATPLVSIATGLSHSCGVGRDGTAYCWGKSDVGQAGVGGKVDVVAEPRPVSGDQSYSTIVAGSAHTCARARDGTAWCWGRNVYGQLGDGTTTDRFAPVQVKGLTRLVSLSATAAHACAMASGGETWCWGYNVDGQIGRDDKRSASSPIRVTAPQR